MRLSGKLLWPLAVLVLGVGVAGTIVKLRPEVERREDATPPPLVRVVEARRQAVRLDVEAQGTVEPRTASELVAEVSGRVVQVSPRFEVGGFFARGEELLRLESRDYELAVAQARAEVARARLALERERAEAEVARREWSELGRGEADPLVLREPQLAEARATLEAAEARQARAELDLERTVVRVPFVGRVSAKHVDLGQYVTPGVRVASVHAVDQAELRLPVPDEQLAFLELELNGARGRRSQALPVRLEGSVAGRRQRWQGVVVRSEGEIDPRTRMHTLVVRVDDPYGLNGSGNNAPLAVGQFVDAVIRGRELEDVFVLPREAMRDENRVLVVDDQQRLRFRDVEVARLEGERAVLVAGLAEGELVCVSPLTAVVDGMRVRVSQQPLDSPSVSPRVEDPA